jgi:ribosomal protein S18 acetylase RimI-like enzyme
MPDRDIRVARCGPGEVPSAAGVESLYHAATCGHPLRETRATAAGYARLYAALLRRPDLEAVAARAAGGQLAGFAYGHGWRWAEQADDWAAQLQERLGGAAGLLDGRFAVYLLAVHPWYRRAGLGRQLLQTLLSATRTGAWLITRDEPTPAMALYQREGWEPIGHGPDTPDGRPGLVLTRPGVRSGSHA